MTKKIIAYMLVCGFTPDSLNADVNKKLNEGWVLYDNPIISNKIFSQVVVKYDTKKWFFW